VGLVLTSGWLALTMALAGPTRWGLATLTVGYTLAWSWSLLDAYQHHYLLSLLLLAMTCFPTTDLDAALDADLHGEWDGPDDGPEDHTPERAEGHERAPAGARVAWGYVLFCVSCATVYFYTAITKMNVDWRDGHALLRLVGHTPGAARMLALAAEHGVSPELFWSAFAKSAIAVQLLCAAGFLLAPVFDRVGSLRKRRLLSFWVLAPLSFHAGAAHMSLKIGWFGEYMLIVAAVVFMPRELLAGATFLLGTPQRAVARWLGAEEPADATAIGAALLAGVALIGLFGVVDLPGDQAAGVTAALLVVGLGVAPLLSGDRSRALSVAVAALAGGAALVFALVQSPARFDYYRKAGGDALRLASDDEPQYYLDGLEHYTRAQRYYPDAYREFWETWDREAAARVARGEPAPDERRARAQGAPPRDRSRQLADAQARVANLRARGVLPPD
jgi:hypothetical protein